MIRLIVALLLTAIVMVIAFLVASVIQVQPVHNVDGNAHELWVYGVTLTIVTLVSGVLFLSVF